MSHISAEEQKIIDIIEYETQCFMERNFEKWADCWLHDENVSILEARPDFAEEIRGWKTISTYMNGILSEGTTELHDSVKKTNFVFQIGTDMAFVRFEENGNASIRVLQKVSGDWKISHVGVVYIAQWKEKGAYIHDWETRNTKLEQTGLLDSE